MELQRISGKHKNNKLLYYLKNYSRLLLPDAYYQKRLINKLKSIPKKEQEEILKRVNYYNKLAYIDIPKYIRMNPKVINS